MGPLLALDGPEPVGDPACLGEVPPEASTRLPSPLSASIFCGWSFSVSRINWVARPSSPRRRAAVARSSSNAGRSASGNRERPSASSSRAAFPSSPPWLTQRPIRALSRVALGPRSFSAWSSTLRAACEIGHPPQDPGQCNPVGESPGAGLDGPLQVFPGLVGSPLESGELGPQDRQVLDGVREHLRGLLELVFDVLPAALTLG